jgi:hypothetical protein
VEPPLEPSAFWGGEEWSGDLFGELRLQEVTAALPKRLGSFPFWRSKASFLEALERFYLRAAPLGLDVFLGLTKASAESPASEKPMQSVLKSAKTLKGKSPPGRRQPEADLQRPSGRQGPLPGVSKGLWVGFSDT